MLQRGQGATHAKEGSRRQSAFNQQELEGTNGDNNARRVKYTKNNYCRFENFEDSALKSSMKPFLTSPKKPAACFAPSADFCAATLAASTPLSPARSFKLFTCATSGGTKHG